MVGFSTAIALLAVPVSEAFVLGSVLLGHKPVGSATSAVATQISPSFLPRSLSLLPASTPSCSRWVNLRGGAARRKSAGPLFATGTASELESLLGSNVGLLSAADEATVQELIALGQHKLLEGWPEAGVEDDKKKSLLEQVRTCGSKYPGGLKAYITKARTLLQESAAGLNPFEGFTPKVPDGISLQFGTEEFEAMEERGWAEMGQTAFVLVAGGLGERLGYDGIKLALPVEVTTRQCYLELYAKHLLALQARCRDNSKDDSLIIPLVIMTSDDTDAKTRALLKAHKNFGMADGQISLVMQDKVPALGDVKASLVTVKGDRFELETKPHGHGDVHHLLHREGLAEKLRAQGKKWLFFFQDTNALVLNSVLPVLGVSASESYDMNSICVPRKAKEAAGAITSLMHDDGSSLIINVEYNQLDPLLRATINEEGDVNDAATGVSPFPGNTNNIVFKLDAYCKVLKGEDEGVVVEFVNPKYADSSKTTFKKPTRLECMMQDFPKLMCKELESPKIGFTSLEKWLSFSPAKNSLDAGAASAKDGVPPGTASSSEAEYYAQAARRLHTATGCHIGDAEEVTFEGVPFELGPRIVLSPSFATCTADLRAKVGSNVRVSSSSTLVIDGDDITLGDVEVDGALCIHAVAGAEVKIDKLKCKNKGWSFVPLPAGASAGAVAEEDRVRGYLVEKSETMKVDISKPGKYVVSGGDGAGGVKIESV